MRKVLEWAFYIWIAGVTVRYGATTWKTLQHPFNPGLDFAWFVGWATLCSLLLLASIFLPARIFNRGALAVFAVAAATILTLSHTWLPAGIALWLLLICGGIGLAILGRLGIPTDEPADFPALAVPSGVGALALAVLALALAGRLSPVWIACVFTVTTLLLLQLGVWKGVVVFLRSMDSPGESVLPRAVIALSALLNLTWAVAPEVQFDSLNYHLAVPQIYLQAAGLVDVRFVQAYLSKLLELLFATGLALGGQTAVKLFVYALGLCAAAATYALGRALVGARAGMWAAALFYTTPVVAWLTGTAYIDNAIALFSAAVLLAFVKWFQTRQNGWFIAASLIAGTAVGSKLNAAFAVFFVLAVMAFALRRQRRTILIGGCAFLLVAMPPSAVVWSFTANPVFPLLNGLFKSPLWAADNTVLNAAEFGLPATLSNLAIFPFRLTLDSTRFGEATPRGALGLSLLLAFPFALWFLPKRGFAVRGVLAAAFIYMVILFYAMQYARFYVAILPAIAVLGAATAFESNATRKSRGAAWLVEGCLIASIVMQFPALTVQYWNIPERFPIGVAFGLESREAFARRALSGYASAMHINRTAAKGDRILGVDVEHLRFYLESPVTTPPVSLLDDPVRKLSDLKPGTELAAAIKQAGFTRLFATTAQVEHLPPGYPYLDKAFLHSYATLEFTDGLTSVYRFKE